MGLDIYLKYSKDRENALKNEAAAEAEVDALWSASDKRYEDYTDEEKESIRTRSSEIRKSYGLDEWGSSGLIEEISEPSKLDPEHYFKLGYFRSSYNAGGINSVMKRASCPDLYDIFQPDEDAYRFTPDWQEALTRCRAAIAQYSEFVNSDAGRYQVIHCSDLGVGGAQDEADALRIFMDNKTKNGDRTDFASYSNRDGHFFLEGRTVRAVIRNDSRGWIAGGVYIVTDKEQVEGKEDWYLTALRIVEETIEHVLAQADPENYFLTWSA